MGDKVTSPAPNGPWGQHPRACSGPRLLGLLLLLVGAALLLALGSGAGGLAGAAATPALVWDLRLPRALCAFAVGGLLALAGTLMQVLLRNPLADPYVLGVSGGAGCAALLALSFGLPAAWLPGCAFAGALASMLLVLTLGRAGVAQDPTRLLLGGVVMAAGWGALVALLLALSPTQRLPGMLFWLMGDLSDADRPLVPLAALAAGTLIALALARPLDLLLQGEPRAAALGIAIGTLRTAAFLLGSLLTGVAVAVAGSIGFLGLVVPHMLRLLGATGHRLLIPAVVLLGGALLLLADTLARTLTAPRELPVGVLTALLGVPLFLYLLRRDAGNG
jgi:iron complex transport system permease protein